MTTYYISPSGSDSNNGLGPDASHASNKPWLTLGKAVGVAGMASGDTVYLAPGVYREAVTVNMTSAVAETSVIGDPANAQGFKDGSGVLLSSGQVQCTAYTTNDTTSPGGSSISLNGRDFLTFRNILFVGGSSGTASCIFGGTSHSTNITFRDCAFVNARFSGAFISYAGLANTAANWLIDRCHFFGGLSGAAITIVPPTSGSADYDMNFVIQNCVAMLQAIFVSVEPSGAGAFKGGGVDVYNCTANCDGFMRTTGANVSTSIPCTVYNNLAICGAGTSLNANTLGQIVEDYNRLASLTPRTNVSIGANSVSDFSHALLVSFGQEYIFGMKPAPYISPWISSPLLGRGNQSVGISVDNLNRPRPAGGASTLYAWGAYERHDVAVKETSIVDAGSNAAKVNSGGPGDHDIHIPVDATLTTITVRMRYDSNHGTGSKPQATILNGEEIGVSTQTVTMTAGVDTWETLTFSNFTPTAKGVITLRLISRSAAGNGIAYFDTITGGAQGTQGMDYYRRGELIQAAVASISGGNPIFGGMVVR